ncbi:MAG TPA: NifB/NifX family molybdenum-iron cluster-binding protein [Tangfeifania sp.]|nr:NifB/NifX family molybdenum-iron cluster-binding protein [Tangfeifania sp.]
MKCAFAVDHENNFLDQHFGEAQNFMIYSWENGKLIFREKLINPHRIVNEKNSHGIAQKGKDIIRLLEKKGVNILISKQFGPNLSLVNQHFIPVIISESQPYKVIEVLEKHMSWIEDEHCNKNGNYMLFRVKHGVLKSQIRTAE